MPRRAVLRSPVTGRPKPVRLEWELAVVWKTVRLVEQAGRSGAGVLKEALVPGWGLEQRPVNTGFSDGLSADLKNFVRLGQSSLSPYEASQINVGLGGGGSWHVEPSERARGFVRGDRVALRLKVPGGKAQTTRGIVVNDGGVLTVNPETNRFEIFHPEQDVGGRGRAKMTILKLLTGALDDGMLRAHGG